MAVLITGATGRIGRVLTGSLVNAGLPVHVLTRRPHRAHEYFGASVTIFEWHPINEPVPKGALQGVDTIIHLMGDPLSGKATADKLQRLTQSRVISMRRLAEAVASEQSSAGQIQTGQIQTDQAQAGSDGRPVRLILASSTGIYPAVPPLDKVARAAKPDTDTGSPAPTPAPGAAETQLQSLNEDAPVHEPATALQRSILQWETAANPFQKSGSSVAVVRLGQVIGADGFPGPLSKLRARGMDIRLDSEAVVPVIALADAVALFAWLYVNPKVVGVINAVAPVPLRGKQINDVLAAQLPGSRFSVSLPDWLARRALGLEVDLIMDRQYITPQRLLQLGFPFSHPDPFEPFGQACKEQSKACRT